MQSRSARAMAEPDAASAASRTNAETGIPSAFARAATTAYCPGGNRTWLLTEETRFFPDDMLVTYRALKRQARAGGQRSSGRVPRSLPG